MRENYHQLELFSASQNTDAAKTHFHSSFLSFIRTYEKIVIIAIAFIVSGIVSFSLGVEKGKNLVKSKVINTGFDMASSRRQKAIPAPVVIDKKDVLKPQKPENFLEKYTVQLASYKGKIYVQKEAERLRKIGFSPLVLPKGNYIVLCVGNFPDKQKAESLVSEFKKYYPDCRIRRL